MLVEFGGMTLDLTLNLSVHALRDDLRRRPIAGLTEAAPGFRSLMVGFDGDPHHIATPTSHRLGRTR